ncbi:DUF1622 domain-containing protein [Alteromonas oceanisediminis]|uniref:DUF1622 domain-containing protein n=1 Tax=Alteromonas oceanisediminis TaxID=2836180 RepID=UPI001BD99903|nr:DUF1622 domain-containing protein [Alteromonas oceanisediminis]MBT0587577.1 DUF1622 domain-containing protein [Alteromonas oceanisediminis]
MTEMIKPIAEMCAIFIESLGILIIVLAAISAIAKGAVITIKRNLGTEALMQIRHHLARGILLGLEFLVAADIIQTVAVTLSFESVGVLAIIVLIRTFLSFTLDLELTGRWPWQSDSAVKKSTQS